MKPLTKLEELVLVAVRSLQPEAHGMAIHIRINSCTHYEPSVGAIYSVLDRLENTGLVTRKLEEKSRQVRGGRRRFFYVSNTEAFKVLKASLKASEKVGQTK